MSPNFVYSRIARVTVAGKAIAGGNLDGDLTQGLRVGFTIDKDLTARPNHAEIVIYNLARGTREMLASADEGVKVVVEAGYRDTGLFVIFAGEMREAFSRPENDGTWATVLRAGDGDSGLRKTRKATSARPGVSFDRVVSETFGQMKIGAGNLWVELKKQLGSDGSLDAQRLGEAFSSGVNGAGSAAEQLVKQLQSAGLEASVQDGEMQVFPSGTLLSTTATKLSPSTGLEGSPSVDAKGVVNVRARILPGLKPGFPLEIDASAASNVPLTLGSGWYAFDVTTENKTLYRIEKTRYVGDTHGADWTCEIDAREYKPKTEAQKEAEKKKKEAADKADQEKNK